MSLAKRLSNMESRIRSLEAWKSGVEEALAAEEASHQEVKVGTLDGEHSDYGERDQTQSLG